MSNVRSAAETRVEKALMAPAVATSRRKEARKEAREEAREEAGQDARHQAQEDNAAPPAAAPAPAGAPTASPVALLDEQHRQLRSAIAELHARIAETSVDVGDRFADEARAMHEGETPARSIRGAATLEEAKELWEDGIPVLPIPVLPEDRN